MRRTLYLATLAAAMLISPALAQNSTTCTQVDQHTNACEFADGSAHVTTVIGDYYSATDYTPEEWVTEKARIAAAEKAENDKRVRDGNRRYGPTLDTKDKCKTAGGKWESTDLPAPNQHRCKLPKGAK